MLPPLRLSIALRYCSNSSTLQKEKILEISAEDNLLEFIDQHDTKIYNKHANSTLRKQNKFRSTRQKKLDGMLLNENQYHPVIFQLLSSKSGAEILETLSKININDYSHEEICQDMDDEDIVEDKYMQPSIHRIYCKGIRCCADLNEFDIAHQIFENCKSQNIVSNELYNTMMWCKMYQSRNERSLRKVFDLYDELQQIIEQNNLKIHPRTYSTLINSCIKVKHYNKAMKILKDIEKNTPELLNHSRVKHAVQRLLLNTKSVDQVIELMNQKAQHDETVWADFDNCGISDILFTLAAKISYGAFNSDLYIEKAEDVFKKSISVAVKCNIDVPCSVFNGMIKVYANNNDYNSCYELLKYMTNPAKKHKVFPSPGNNTFYQMLKSLDGCENKEEKWEKMDQICKIMALLKIGKGAHFYCSLLDLCDDNISRAKKYYNELVDVDKLVPNMAMLQCLFVVGVNHYKNKDSKEFEQFVRYIIEQHSQYNIVPTEQIKQQWKTAMTE